MGEKAGGAKSRALAGMTRAWTVDSVGGVKGEEPGRTGGKPIGWLAGAELAWIYEAALRACGEGELSEWAGPRQGQPGGCCKRGGDLDGKSPQLGLFIYPSG